LKGLKIPVSVVRFRPWAPISTRNRTGLLAVESLEYRRLCFDCASAYRRLLAAHLGLLPAATVIMEFREKQAAAKK